MVTSLGTQYCIMEEVFPISGFNTPQKQYFKPFDTLSINSVTSIHSDPFDLDDDPERVAAYDALRLRELVANFARGFDAENFPAYVKGWMANIHKDLFPGSYAHLMIILLEDWDRMEHFQVSMFKWLCEEHPVPPFYNWNSAPGEDHLMFVSELEILQKLLSPLRGDNSRPVHWIGTRIANADDSCNQIKTSMRIIKHFKEEISAEIHGSDDDRTIYSPRNSTPDDRKAEASVREFRMDTCRASLGWGEFLKTDLYFTSFHQSYKSSLIDTAPERARAIGFLPPLQPAIPKYIPVNPDVEPVAWCIWPREDLRNGILDLILKIPVWLGLARGAAAVHLFCDVVRAFTLKMPTQSTPCDRITLLYRFTALRVSCEGIESGLATPFAYDDNVLSDKNSDYFTDVESSVRSEHNLDISSNCDSAFMDYFKPSSAESQSQKLPHIHHRSRISQGQIKLYHDRDVLETLSQASTERTLSSKMVPERPAVPLQLLSKMTATPLSESPLEAMLRTFYSRFSEEKRLPRHVVNTVQSCPHIHQLLFTVINRKGNLPPLTGFHHWGTGSEHKSRIILSNRGPNDLRYIYGFQELGTVWIPESNASSLDDVHQYLDLFVPRQQETLESEITESIVEALRGGGGGLSSPAIPIQLFTILVYGNAKDELFTGGDDIPEWIWMKPQSTYFFLKNFRTQDIDDCIDNEEMQPTKEVHILVRGGVRRVNFCSGIEGYEEEPYGPKRPLFIFH